ncbi:MAG: radical SAM protein [Clostridiales bacterium]|nr:radical SAM protein [Clostridiales bacterium]
MKLKKLIKYYVYSLHSGFSEILYRRPYFDHDVFKKCKSSDSIAHLDLVVTECCSLKCRDCSNLMQYYHHPENLSTDEVVKDLKTVLDCIHVGELKILGGEPFVNQKTVISVYELLSGEYKDRVDSINIITNGTIVPGDDCINAMKNNTKTVVTFSNYGELSKKQGELIAICKSKGIRYVLTENSYNWRDFGKPIKYDENEEFLKVQYKHCYNRKSCNTLYRGAIYVCPRQAHGIRLGLLPDIKDERVDLYDPLYADKDGLRRAIKKLVNRKQPISSCSYCINGKYVHVARGVQEKK